ncbi:putative bifunctional diguanylate cyclase/phosphodiesterase [Parasphingopyxis lamellibrachiae]|uniref:Diguanylate cyclase/phosphodiesterase n=1 Tax=Parasphingopyxis lamellibrachiae TaxID=680125 RepID=A0A3D9FD18_9SPHN|nr:EAL domain-containing protein [Parasphingopyxis lamellibrachiae]RED15472.1 diguanylate cyclase/phosphodiesterase [Parasphingopyxis lamellibrachiae]
MRERKDVPSIAESADTEKLEHPRAFVSATIALLSILMFAGIGGEVIASIIAGTASDRDPVLAVALILNIALILIGWRHHNEVTVQIQNHKEATKQARSLALRDPLTGFLNRRSLTGEVDAMIKTAATRNRVVAMFVIDLDSFKYVNDLNGHHVGDVLLREVGKRIMSALPGSALGARLGGDEFAAAFQFDPSNPAAVDAVADELVERISLPFDIEKQSVQTSASVGITRSDHDCNGVETLLRRADIAMYAAKHQGKNRAVWFDGSMERMLEERNRVEQGMRRGIPAGEFAPYYEQQIDLLTGKLHGFEVLARWEHPTRGLIMPEDFIPVAEECGLISELSEYVMRKAFTEARDWDQGLTLSVNISPAQLKDPWLAQKIIKLLTETNFPASRLEIEITETALFDNLGIAQSIISSLKNQGIRIALDDFGTGYSSLAHLRALPFDRIKIDRSFVTSINDDNESAAIVDAITRLGSSLGLPVTAEGIETAQIATSLKDLGSMAGQGWHYGKPMAIGQTRRLLADKDMLTSGPKKGVEKETLDDMPSLRRSG